MGWTLELVQTGSSGERGRLRVAELGEVPAPTHVDEVGLGLTMAQRLLGQLQAAFVAIQEAALRAKAVRMRAEDPTLRLKDHRRRSLQTLFGAVHLRVPRLTCVVPGHEPPVLLPGSRRSSIEYDRLRARLGAWMSYRAGAHLLAELFPLAVGRHASTVQRHVLRQADRLARAPAGPSAGDPDTTAAIDLGLDTTFIRSCAADGPRHHEVLIGVGVNDRGRAAKIAGVIAAVEQPHRLVSAALRSLERGPATEVTAFTDGAKLLRQLLRKAGVKVSPILDWQHVARRVQVTKQAARGLRGLTNAEHRARPRIAETLESLHWTLWHGQVAAAKHRMARVERLLRPFDIDRTRARTAAPARRLHTALGQLRDYVGGQSAHLVDYHRRQRAGLPIGTSTTESLANTLVNRRMNKSQQMRWSARGAHAVLVVRTARGDAPGATPAAMPLAA
jgi:hypothetical protein